MPTKRNLLSNCGHLSKKDFQLWIHFLSVTCWLPQTALILRVVLALREIALNLPAYLWATSIIKLVCYIISDCYYFSNIQDEEFKFKINLLWCPKSLIYVIAIFYVASEKRTQTSQQSLYWEDSKIYQYDLKNQFLCTWIFIGKLTAILSTFDAY